MLGGDNEKQNDGRMCRLETLQGCKNSEVLPNLEVVYSRRQLGLVFF